MKEHGLRPCTVEIGEVVERVRYANGISKSNVIKEAETYKCYFHTWGTEAYTVNGFIAGTTPGQVSTLYGLVEYEDGTMHKVDPECIIFTDRGCGE